MGTSLASATNIGTVTQIISAYAFTTVGFLATVITLLLGLSQRPFFERYRKRGHLVTFLWGYFVTMVSLFAVFGTSLVVLAKPNLLNWLISATEVTLVQLTLLCFVAYNLLRKSAE